MGPGAEKEIEVILFTRYTSCLIAKKGEPKGGSCFLIGITFLCRRGGSYLKTTKTVTGKNYEQSIFTKIVLNTVNIYF
jgi:hypothetical protein